MRIIYSNIKEVFIVNKISCRRICKVWYYLYKNLRKKKLNIVY